MSNDAILSYLNPVQQAAVMATEGPVLILAGPGSGKTRCITYRVAYLIREKKVDPENIVTLTFTNKAANEMKERVVKLLSPNYSSSQKPFMGTFHSFCARILRHHGKNLGLSPNFLIFDENDQLDVVKQAMKELEVSTRDFSPKAIRAAISSAKNELISETEYPQYAQGYFQKMVAKIFPYYQKLLRQNEALDFDDLLTKTVKLFKQVPEVLSKHQGHFRYILVDEYQDTNHAQYILTKLLAGQWRNLCVVGDASQAIYGFRGADYRNVLNLKNDFPEIKIFNLEQNYRSTQKILDAAFFVVSQNTTHPILKLWTKNPKGQPPFLYEAKNEQDEASFILHLIASAGNRLSDFVVLYRTNAQSRVFEETFLHAGIPYLLVGGVRFYERREIKDILAFLRMLANPKDMISYKRIEKLGKGRLKKFLKWAENIEKAIGRKTTLELIDKVLRVTGYLELYDPKDNQDFARLENIKELRSVATEFPELNQFLENVALIQQEHLPDQKPTFNQQKPEAITLMTAHAAKGLEFPIVFMTGMEEGLFPHSRSLMDKFELEEERRLCYVGMTRAKKRLYFTYARRRLYFGNRLQNPISRFITDIPENLIKVVDYLKSHDL
jgi:DNA helicase-2/ATP-dependent DNA helicase PcrA